MLKDILLVLSNSADGEDDTFNEWYDDVHAGDILSKLDGFKAIQRFKLAPLSDSQDAPWQYLAIYEIEPGNVEASYQSIVWSRGERAEAEAEGREPAIPIPSAMTADRVAWWFSALGDRRTS